MSGTHLDAQTLLCVRRRDSGAFHPCSGFGEADAVHRGSCQTLGTFSSENLVKMPDRVFLSSSSDVVSCVFPGLLPPMAIFVHTRQGRWLLALVLAIPCLLIVFPMIASVRSMSQAEASARAVEHATQVQTHTGNLLRLIVDAEAGQRGYVLTNRKEFLEPYAAALTAIPGELSARAGLAQELPSGDDALERIRPLIDQKLESMGATIELAARGRGREAVARVTAGGGKALMDQLRTLIGDLRQEQARMLAERQDRLRADARFRTTLMIILLGLNVLFAGAIYYLIWRYFRLDAFVTMCAWSRTVEYGGEWLTFEAYLKRRFGVQTSHGISPAQAEKIRWTLRSTAESKG